jgi:hypothetical protein
LVNERLKMGLPNGHGQLVGRSSSVVTRLDRVIQYCGGLMSKYKGPGILSRRVLVRNCAQGRAMTGASDRVAILKYE